MYSSSITSSKPVIFVYISCVLLVKLGSEVSVGIPKVSFRNIFIFRIPLVYVFLIGSTFIFMPWTVLFISLHCVSVFWISLRELLISSLRNSTIFITETLGTLGCFSFFFGIFSACCDRRHIGLTVTNSCFCTNIEGSEMDYKPRSWFDLLEWVLVFWFLHSLWIFEDSDAHVLLFH